MNLKKEIFLPARSLIPATTTFADAPISVKLPPKSPPDGQGPPQGAYLCVGEAFRLRQLLYHRDHGRGERDVVHDPTGDGASPHHEHRRNGRRVAGTDEELGYSADKTRDLEAPDEHEEADEEEQRRPLHLTQDLFDVAPCI